MSGAGGRARGRAGSKRAALPGCAPATSPHTRGRRHAHSPAACSPPPLGCAGGRCPPARPGRPVGARGDVSPRTCAVTPSPVRGAAGGNAPGRGNNAASCVPCAAGNHPGGDGVLGGGRAAGAMLRGDPGVPSGRHAGVHLALPQWGRPTDGLASCTETCSACAQLRGRACVCKSSQAELAPRPCHLPPGTAVRAGTRAPGTLSPRGGRVPPVGRTWAGFVHLCGCTRSPGGLVWSVSPRGCDPECGVTAGCPHVSPLTPSPLPQAASSPATPSAKPR